MSKAVFQIRVINFLNNSTNTTTRRADGQNKQFVIVMFLKIFKFKTNSLADN